MPDLTFILGGASSGKSSYAERIVVQSGRPRVYIATAQAFDPEMADKIAQHREDRGPNWTTIEEPLHIGPVITAQEPDSVILLDCATLWLTNVMLTDDAPDLDAAFDGLLGALAECPCPVVVVSNEVGLGIVPENSLSRRFRAAQGQLNARIAARADCVAQVIAGLPLCLKGKLPG